MISLCSAYSHVIRTELRLSVEVSALSDCVDGFCRSINHNQAVLHVGREMRLLDGKDPLWSCRMDVEIGIVNAEIRFKNELRFT